MNISDVALIKNIIQNGCVMSVIDEEGVLQKRTNCINAIVDSIDSVEECFIRVYKDSIKLGCLFYVDSELNDHTDNKEINELIELFA